MSLDTIPTSISSHAVKKYLAKLDERGETYEFIVGGTSDSNRYQGPLELVLHREGDADVLELHLNMDGTWAAQHVLVVGEKQ